MRSVRPAPIALAVAAVLSLSLAMPAAADAAFGAIAVNPKTGAAGLSWNYPTQDGAKRHAERQCAGRCRIAVWVRNQCAAVVATRTRFVSGVGGSKRKALLDARRRAHNPAAKRVAWVCSG